MSMSQNNSNFVKEQGKDSGAPARNERFARLSEKIAQIQVGYKKSFFL